MDRNRPRPVLAIALGALILLAGFALKSHIDDMTIGGVRSHDSAGAASLLEQSNYHLRGAQARVGALREGRSLELVAWGMMAVGAAYLFAGLIRLLPTPSREGRMALPA